MLFLAGMMIATVYDYQITSALSGLQKENGVYSLNVKPVIKAIEIVGDWTTPVLAAFSAIVTEINFRRKLKEKGRLIFFGATTVFSLGMMYYGSAKTMEVLSGGELSAVHYVAAVIITIVLSFLIRFVTENMSRKRIRKFFRAAFFTLAAVIVMLLSVEAVKIFWGRIRMREIVTAANEGGIAAEKIFRRWYEPEFFSGSHSFPSGHSAQATALLLLPLWLGKSDAVKKKKAVLTGFIGLWISVMCFSRLCAGAHFLSDVLCGFAISYVIVEITYYLYNKTYEESFFPFETTREVSIALIKKELPAKEAPAKAEPDDSANETS